MEMKYFRASYMDGTGKTRSDVYISDGWNQALQYALQNTPGEHSLYSLKGYMSFEDALYDEELNINI